jgi:cell division protein FtsI/penicillin-binding protein 2
MASRKIKGDKIVDNTASILTNPITPGSVVKGASMLVGYNSGAIHIGSELVDECIKVRGVPEKCSFKTLGRIDDITALAKSSNVYQFKTAIRVNEQEYFPDMGLVFRQSSFDRYRKMYRSFGLGNSTGIDLPFESHGYTSKDKRAGNLLDFVIGQYETYTPLQLSQYVSTIATSGKRYQLHLLKKVEDVDGNKVYKYDNKVLNKIKTQDKYMKRVRSGFYAVCHAPGAYGVGYLDNRLDGSGKTGTSQSFIDTTGNGVIDTETITSSFIGYFPTNKPKYSITVTSPNSSIPSEDGFASLVTYRLTGKISEYMYENYIK